MLPCQSIDRLCKIRLVDEQPVPQPAFIEHRTPYFPCRKGLYQLPFCRKGCAQTVIGMTGQCLRRWTAAYIAKIGIDLLSAIYSCFHLPYIKTVTQHVSVLEIGIILFHNLPAHRFGRIDFLHHSYDIIAIGPGRQKRLCTFLHNDIRRYGHDSPIIKAHFHAFIFVLCHNRQAQADKSQSQNTPFTLHELPFFLILLIRIVHFTVFFS